MLTSRMSKYANLKMRMQRCKFRIQKQTLDHKKVIRMKKKSSKLVNYNQEERELQDKKMKQTILDFVNMLGISHLKTNSIEEEQIFE
jgi:hypothetical protein